jgi:hypothetical protein
MCGRRLPQRGAAHCLVERAERSELFGASRAGRDVRFNLARMTGVELAVDQRVEQNFGFGAIHDFILPE